MVSRLSYFNSSSAVLNILIIIVSASAKNHPDSNQLRELQSKLLSDNLDSIQLHFQRASSKHTYFDHESGRLRRYKLVSLFIERD